MTDEQPKTSLIEFPSDFPLKIMGVHAEEFASEIVMIVQRHDDSFDVSTIEARPSRNGNYLSLTCTIRAISQEQLDALYRELTGHPMVKVVL